jgi:hypothetical protein
VKDKSGYQDYHKAQGQEAFGLRIAETPKGNTYWIEDQQGRIVFQGRQREQNLIRQLDILECLLDWHARKQRWSKSFWWLEWHRQELYRSSKK